MLPEPSSALQDTAISNSGPDMAAVLDWSAPPLLVASLLSLLLCISLWNCTFAKGPPLVLCLLIGLQGIQNGLAYLWVFVWQHRALSRVQDYFHQA